MASPPPPASSASPKPGDSANRTRRSSPSGDPTPTAARPRHPRCDERIFSEKTSARAAPRPELDKAVALVSDGRASGMPVILVVHEPERLGRDIAAKLVVTTSTNEGPAPFTGRRCAHAARTMNRSTRQ
ncbi:recombinase family protein [Streptomyces avidinii]|uniref:recombinase family protein n=1 Tax=Streptomyces avidinii TaxID=1895 RepID=UPI003869DCF8|nr:recombinase family protein [Streptomyces avidinii]